MTGLFRVIFFLLILLGLRMLFSRLFGGGRKRSFQKNRARPREVKKTISGRMVKDPYCGTYVATELAIPARCGGETLHFCSPECRESFLRKDPVKTPASQ